MAKKFINENEEIVHVLKQEEIDYPGAAAKFGPEALPFLNEIIKGSDEKLARNAAYLAGYIKSDQTAEVLQNASASPFATVRIAAAYGAASQDASKAKEILTKSISDQDHGVLKVAMRSIRTRGLSKDFTREIKGLQTKNIPEELKTQAKGIIK